MRWIGRAERIKERQGKNEIEKEKEKVMQWRIMCLRVSVDCVTPRQTQHYAVDISVSLVAIIKWLLLLCLLPHKKDALLTHVLQAKWMKKRREKKIINTKNPCQWNAGYCEHEHHLKSRALHIAWTHSRGDEHTKYSTWSFWFCEHIPQPFIPCSPRLFNVKMLKLSLSFSMWVCVCHKIKIMYITFNRTESITQDHGIWIKCGI